MNLQDRETVHPALARALVERHDFKAFVHDVSSAILFALERRHLEYLDLRQASPPQAVQSLAPGDLFFLRLAQIGHGIAEERGLDLLNLQNVLGTYRSGTHSLVVALASDGTQARLYLGARRMDTYLQAESTSYDFVQNLRRSVEGNLPGTRFQAFSPDQSAVTCPDEEVYLRIAQPLLNYPYLAAVTGIPSLRGERQDQFAQSMDRLIQALQGQQYLMLVVADPLPGEQMNEVLADCLRLGSEVHAWVRTGMSLAQASGASVSRGETTGEVTGGAESLSHSHGEAHGRSRQPGAALGGLFTASLALGLSPMVGPASLQIGGLAGSILSGVVGGVSDNISDNETTSRTKSWSDSVSRSLMESTSTTETTSTNMEYLNKTAEYCERMIDGYIQRLQRGKSLGMWNVGVYFFAEDPSTFAQGQSQIRALYSGRDTHFEPMRALDLSRPLTRNSMGIVLASYNNPLLDLKDSWTGESIHHPLGKLHRSLSTPLNTEELSVLLNLPRREVPGLKLQVVADFGVNPAPLGPSAIPLGTVVSGGMPIHIPVGLEMEDLTRHVFVTGLTGSGKTNTCFTLLKALAKRGIPFLVIEPAKGEYRSLVGDPDIPDLQVYTLGDETISPFRINPFQFVPGMNLVTHLDNLKAIFNASFPMYAAMPYLLEEAVIACFEERGWDLVRSTNSRIDMERVVTRWKQGEPDYSYTIHLPTLSDLMRKIDQVVEAKGYAAEVTRNYAAALKARINSLLLGSKGSMLNVRRGIPFEDLFARPTVLELRSMGDDDEKCFMMALLLVQLYEYREQQHRWKPRRGLRHLTIIEESHRLLGQAGPAASMEAANPRAKAVESFANMLAEIREYGEGFLIIDQTPAKLIPDVVKNTSTKILHRLAARDDRDAMGDAMGMTEEQKLMVPRLRVGDAVFHTQDQDKPIWIKVEPAKGKREPAADELIQMRMIRRAQDRSRAELAEIAEEGACLAQSIQQLTDSLRKP